MRKPAHSYFSYLLRMWQVTRGRDQVWFASLEDPHTGNRHSFTSLEGLFAFLETQIFEADRQSHSRLAQPDNQGRPPEEPGPQ
jgi:hypothetical protein